MTATKRCPDCGEVKTHSEIGRNQSLGDGLSFYCLACNRRRNRAWYRRRRESTGLTVRDHSWISEGFRWCPVCQQPVAHEDYTRNSRTASGFGSRCRACDRAENAAAYLHRTHGITRADLDALRAAQGDRCGICGEPGPEHLDHDHATGRTRRLLCQRCNQGLGLFRDDPALLHTAALYAQGHREQHASERLALAEAPGPAEAPPVGSHRRQARPRAPGRTSGFRRQRPAREADG
ncbi:endonuclease domain-containing protein [Geodermatophilus sp. SYSU D00758]